MKNSFLYFFGRKCKRGYKSDTFEEKKKKEKLLIEVGEMGKNMVTRMDIKVTLTNNKKNFQKYIIGNLEARLNLNRSWT